MTVLFSHVAALLQQVGDQREEPWNVFEHRTLGASEWLRGPGQRVAPRDAWKLNNPNPGAELHFATYDFGEDVMVTRLFSRRDDFDLYVGQVQTYTGHTPASSGSARKKVKDEAA